ncbi:hypothetical protein Tco_1050731 [Tanacetum coccineum]
MNDMMNPKRRGDRNGRRSEGEESENPFFEGDGSSSVEQPDRPRTLFVEPIIWDIGDEEEEYPFVNKYPSFQEEPIVLVEEESCPVTTPITKKKNRCRFMILILKMSLRRKKGLLGKKNLVEKKTT